MDHALMPDSSAMDTLIALMDLMNKDVVSSTK